LTVTLRYAEDKKQGSAENRPEESEASGIELEFEDPLEAAGWTQVHNVVLRDARLSMPARMCYFVLRSHGWQKPGTFVGQNRIAGELGCSVRQVRRYLDELIEAELVLVRRRGRRQSNVYTFARLSRRYRDMGVRPPQGDRTPMSHSDRTPMSRDEYAVEKEKAKRAADTPDTPTPRTPTPAPTDETHLGSSSIGKPAPAVGAPLNLDALRRQLQAQHIDGQPFKPAAIERALERTAAVNANGPPARSDGRAHNPLAFALRIASDEHAAFAEQEECDRRRAEALDLEQERRIEQRRGPACLHGAREHECGTCLGQRRRRNVEHVKAFRARLSSPEPIDPGDQVEPIEPQHLEAAAR
jgi:hypothetical protein